LSERRFTYAAVTPVRNEEQNLERLSRSLVAQTRTPTRWVIVDNGSTDETAAMARDLAASNDWVSVISVAGERRPEPGAPIVRAFHAGLRELDPGADVIVKLDADVSMDPGHFEQLLDAFARDPELGIASGTCLEADPRGAWRAVPVTAGHVRGAVRAYRSDCLDQVLPLEERVGWDGIDELKAGVLGWKTQMLPELAFYHHRALGERDAGRAGRWQAQGRASHFMGYRFSYLVLRSLHHARRDRGALTMISSYLGAALRREPRYGDPAVRAYLREKQSLRNIGARARETRGAVRPS
jgi:glycosyltransferase involved in cell wall biosynthesis